MFDITIQNDNLFCDNGVSFNFGNKESFKYDIISYIKSYLNERNKIKEQYKTIKI